MKFFSHVCFCFIFFSCAKEINIDDNQSEMQHTRVVSKALYDGYYKQLEDHIGLSVYNGKAFLLINKDDTLIENFALWLSFDSDIESNGMNKEIVILRKISVTGFGNLKIISGKIQSDEYKSLRVGRVTERDTLWGAEISHKEITKSASVYGNEFQGIIGRNVIEGEFEKDLQTGVFFKNESGFYILIGEESIYFIASGNKKNNSNIMLHFLRENNTFINLSFLFKNKRIDRLLSSKYSNLIIAKVEVPRKIKYSKIRIGEFNSDGNLWLKILDINSIKNNKLLRYNEEFKKE